MTQAMHGICQISVYAPQATWLAQANQMTGLLRLSVICLPGPIHQVDYKINTMQFAYAVCPFVFAAGLSYQLLQNAATMFCTWIRKECIFFVL